MLSQLKSILQQAVESKLYLISVGTDAFDKIRLRLTQSLHQFIERSLQDQTHKQLCDRQHLNLLLHLRAAQEDKSPASHQCNNFYVSVRGIFICSLRKLMKMCA